MGIDWEGKMKLLGRELSISAERADAASMIGLFTQIGTENSDKFQKDILDKCADLDKTLERVSEISFPYFIDAINRAKDILEENKVTGYDRDSLFKYLYTGGYLDLWNELLGECIDKYKELDPSAGLKNDYTKRIKGAGGKTKEVGISFEEVGAFPEGKKKLYELMCDYLPRTLCESTGDFAFAVMAIITKETGHKYDAPSKEDVAKARELYDSVAAGKVPEAERDDALFKAISLDPNNADAFYYFVLKYGDSNNEIETLAESFGNPIHQMKIDGFVKYQEKALTKKLDSFSKMEDDESQKELNAIRNGLINIKKCMGISAELITAPEIMIDEAIRERKEGKAGGGDMPKAAEETPITAEAQAPTEAQAENQPQTPTEAQAALEPQKTTESQAASDNQQDEILKSSPQAQKPVHYRAQIYEVKRICQKFVTEADVPELYEPSKKLMAVMGLEEGEEIFLGQDKTIFGTGKEGFAITNLGIICVMNKAHDRTTYDELAKKKTLEWANPDFKNDLLADGMTLIKCLPTDKDDVLGLISAIKQVV